MTVKIVKKVLITGNYAPKTGIMPLKLELQPKTGKLTSSGKQPRLP